MGISKINVETFVISVKAERGANTSNFNNIIDAKQEKP